MRRLILLFGPLAIVLGVAGSASAGYWEVVYDLAGSTVQTIVTAAGTDDLDDVTGSFTIQYDTVETTTAPITGARLVAGDTKLVMFQTNLGLFLFTGTSDTVLSPPTGGIVGTINGATLSGLSAIPNAVTGFMHCYNSIADCSLANFTSSVPRPQTPPTSVPLNLGNLVFTGSGTAPVGNSDFTSTGTTIVIPPNPPASPFTVTLVSVYVGKEISRTFVPEPAGWVQLAAVGASLLVLAIRRRTTSLAPFRTTESPSPPRGASTRV